MDLKYNQFVIFATVVIILILISLFSHNIYFYITGEKINKQISKEFKPVDLGEAPIDETRIHVVAHKDHDVVVHGGNQGDTRGDVRGDVRGPKMRAQRGSGGGGQGPTQNINIQLPSNGSQPSGQNVPNTRGGNNIQNASPQATPAGSSLSNYLNNLFQSPSLPNSSRNVPQSSYLSSLITPAPGVSGSNSVSSLISTALTNLTPTPTLPTSLDNTNNLQQAQVSYSDVSVGDTAVVLKIGSGSSLASGMQLVIASKNYTVINVVNTNFGYIIAYLDKPVTDFVKQGTFLTILGASGNNNNNAIVTYAPGSSALSPSQNFNMAPISSGTGANNPTVNTPVVPPPRQTYILHLSNATNTNGKLMFTASVNVTTDLLQQIASKIVTTVGP
jgi:hypothetical protein